MQLRRMLCSLHDSTAVCWMLPAFLLQPHVVMNDLPGLEPVDLLVYGCALFVALD
jgi:hypothetical protein